MDPPQDFNKPTRVVSVAVSVSRNSMVPVSKVWIIGGGRRVSPMFPLCEMEPLVASTVIDDIPAVAEAETMNVTA